MLHMYRTYCSGGALSVSKLQKVNSLVLRRHSGWNPLVIQNLPIPKNNTQIQLFKLLVIYAHMYTRPPMRPRHEPVNNVVGDRAYNQVLVWIYPNASLTFTKHKLKHTIVTKCNNNANTEELSSISMYVTLTNSHHSGNQFKRSLVTKASQAG